MDELILKELLEKYRSGTCSKEDIILLESWYLSESKKPGAEIAQDVLIRAHERIGVSIAKNTGLSLDQMQRPIIKLWPRIAAAASIILCLSVAAIYFSRSRPLVEIVGNDILPGSNKAILTLSNGHQIILTNIKNGMLSRQGSTSVIKKANGQIQYEGSYPKENATPEIAYNTLSTPKGGEYHLVLSDGTEVWLNAASTITYPVTFAGSERRVTTTGEVYFEVVHNPAKPFKVSTSAQTVEVLGTHFNIDAYSDEEGIKTTLLEGSVKIAAGSEVKIIKPGQQATSTDHDLSVGNADVEESIAWKNGYFRFNDETIGDVMRKISKWYDIDVVYGNDVSKEGFTGAISRYKNISQVLKMIAQTGAVKFKVEGRRVTVLQI
jgi:transmembrane sensor